MDLRDIFTWGGAGVLLLLSFIKIPKIEVNIWGWIGRKVGKSVNGELIQKIDDINVKVEQVEGTLGRHLKNEELYKIKQCRERILRFASDVCRGQKYTEEQWNEILDDVDTYEKYCVDNPDYKNTKAITSIGIIKKSYNNALEKQDFLLQN